MTTIRPVPKWEADRTREEKISLNLKPVEVMGFAWEAARERLLPEEIDEVARKVEKKREEWEKRGNSDNNDEIDEVVFIREVAKSIPKSWHRELLLKFVNEYAKRHNLSFDDYDE